MALANAAGFFRQTDIRWMCCLSLGLLLGGCSHAIRKEPPPPPATKQVVAIGIPACDAYLSSYLACHRAAAIYPADSLQSHYQAMRLSLQQGASDPQVRPYLAHRCLGLSQQLQATLQGRSCTAQAATPQTVSTTPARTQH